eukprot:scpid109783/ scgid11321/ 
MEDAETSVEAIVSPSCKVKRLDWNSCICHDWNRRLKGDGAKLVAVSAQSWQRLHCVAKQRGVGDETHDFFFRSGVTDESNAQGFYHRKCYQDYTSKSNVDRFLKRQQQCPPETQATAPSV